MSEIKRAEEKSLGAVPLRLIEIGEVKFHADVSGKYIEYNVTEDALQAVRRLYITCPITSEGGVQSTNNAVFVKISEDLKQLRSLMRAALLTTLTHDKTYESFMKVPAGTLQQRNDTISG